MDVADAFRRLGLAETATLAEIGEQYRVRALEVHPDRGGTNAAFVELQEAHAIAVKHCSARSQLIPFAEFRQLIPNDRLALKADVQAVLGRVLRIRLSRFRARQRQLGALGVMVGVLTWLMTKYSPLQFAATLESSFGADVLTLMGIMVLVFVFLLYLSLRATLRAYEEAVADLDDVFSDKQNYYLVLHDLLKDSCRDFSTADLRQATQSRLPPRGREYAFGPWFPTPNMRGIFIKGAEVDFPHISRILGPEDLARYLTKKGLEIGALAETKTHETGIPQLRYSLV